VKFRLFDVLVTFAWIVVPMLIVYTTDQRRRNTRTRDQHLIIRYSLGDLRECHRVTPDEVQRFIRDEEADLWEKSRMENHA
jgi:hypothetical protein